MKTIVQINIRISKDCSGNDRFTQEEVESLIKKNEIIFSKNLVLRKSDKKIIGEIENKLIEARSEIEENKSTLNYIPSPIKEGRTKGNIKPRTQTKRMALPPKPFPKNN